LCDYSCFNDCKFTKQHYKEISELQLGKIPTDERYGKCKYMHLIDRANFIANRNKFSKYYISPEDIQNIYAPMGFQYFKLSGREKYNFIGNESIINYLIKPEYQNDVRCYIYERLMLECAYDAREEMKYKF